jgi:serine/threonine-protein kinase HipA
MRRREAQLARAEGREERRLLESDYLLGVHDGHRMGALRFRMGERFLDDNDQLASPPWTSLRELEHASLQLERDGAEDDPDYGHWLRMLIAPGGSLGGARPKACVRDERGRLWIAKFPSRLDEEDVGAWEHVVHVLAGRAGIVVPPAEVRRFGTRKSGGHGHHTFLSQRFDRTAEGERVHFASAMTLLDRKDGAGAHDGASYLELADLLMRLGEDAPLDLEQLWRRIVFSVCVSNTDDHLRNHGFLLGVTGWLLAPAYDINPDPHRAGLKLNISETDRRRRRPPGAGRSASIAPRPGSAGMPSKTTRPPSWPAPGPRSMIQSACAITVWLCSMTITDLPPSTRRSSSPSSCARSARCRPVVGSSST